MIFSVSGTSLSYDVKKKVTSKFLLSVPIIWINLLFWYNEITDCKIRMVTEIMFFFLQKKKNEFQWKRQIDLQVYIHDDWYNYKSCWYHLTIIFFSCYQTLSLPSLLQLVNHLRQHRVKCHSPRARLLRGKKPVSVVFLWNFHHHILCIQFASSRTRDILIL